MTTTSKTLVIVLGIALTLLCAAALAGLLIASRVFSSVKATPAALVFPTRGTAGVPAADTPAPNRPSGKIVFVCQLFKNQAQDQLCLINADGTGWRRLTQDDTVRSFYPSLAPDGNSVVFSSNIDGNFKLYEITLAGQLAPLGNTVGYAPEISPDNTQVVFTNSDGQQQMIWVMNRDGANRRLLYTDAWDPTWAPDGKKILFATNIDGKPQLANINLDGSGFQQISRLPFLRGRSDWSSDGAHIVTYSGESWHREIFLLNADGSSTRQITPAGGNSQGPSFSPDGQWVAFTAYYDSIGNENGCEIYIMQINGENLTRLTNNAYCDWQPRWGP